MSWIFELRDASGATAALPANSWLPQDKKELFARIRDAVAVNHVVVDEHTASKLDLG